MHTPWKSIPFHYSHNCCRDLLKNQLELIWIRAHTVLWFNLSFSFYFWSTEQQNEKKFNSKKKGIFLPMVLFWYARLGIKYIGMINYSVGHIWTLFTILENWFEMSPRVTIEMNWNWNKVKIKTRRKKNS